MKTPAQLIDEATPTGGPPRLAQLIREAIRNPPPKRTKEEREAIEAARAAEEAAERARHAALQAERWPEHLLHCGAPGEAIAALRSDSPHNTPALERAREFLASRHRFLVLSGFTGTGKTVAGCWCLRAAVRVETRTGLRLEEWSSEAGLCVRLGRLLRLSDYDERAVATLQQAWAARVLVLDEVGGRPGEFLTKREQETLDELLDHRDEGGKRTVLCTNLSLQKPEGKDEGGRDRVSDFATFMGEKNLSRIARSCLLRDVGRRDLRRAGGAR